MGYSALVHFLEPSVWVGIGCQRGSSRQLLEEAIQTICQTHGVAERAIAGLATLDLKANEPGLVELCRDRDWPLRCFSAADLRTVSVPTPSERVNGLVETLSVAEAAALLASQMQHSSIDLDNLTDLLVPKTVFRLKGQPQAVTVAIAQAAAAAIRQNLLE